jgi:hypothetical protein
VIVKYKVDSKINLKDTRFLLKSCIPKIPDRTIKYVKFRKRINFKIESKRRNSYKIINIVKILQNITKILGNKKSFWDIIKKR